MSVRTQIALALWIMVGVAALTVFQALPAKVTDYQDFRYYYGGSLALRRGINPYGADFETIFAQIGTPVGSASAWERAEIQLDTPAWLIFFEPFTLLQPRAAYWTWAAFNLLALGAALFGLIGELGPPGAEGWTVAALMLLYPPIAINFWLAQSEIVLLAIFVLALAALRRGYHGRAGVILAAAALLRAYPLGMLGYLVARRNWRASGYFLAACVIGCALAVGFAGFEPVVSFAGLAATTSATHARGVPAGLLRHPANLNLGAFVQLVLGERAGASVAALAIELVAAGIAFAATAALEDDRYGFAFALWLVVITCSRRWRGRSSWCAWCRSTWESRRRRVMRPEEKDGCRGTCSTLPARATSRRCSWAARWGSWAAPWRARFPGTCTYRTYCRRRRRSFRSGAPISRRCARRTGRRVARLGRVRTSSQYHPRQRRRRR